MLGKFYIILDNLYSFSTRFFESLGTLKRRVISRTSYMNSRDMLEGTRCVLIHFILEIYLKSDFSF